MSSEWATPVATELQQTTTQNYAKGGFLTLSRHVFVLTPINADFQPDGQAFAYEIKWTMDVCS